MTQYHNKDGPSRVLPLLAAGVCALVVLALALPGYAQKVGSEVCADCHDEVSEAFSGTPHGIYFSGRPALQEYGCESCHGAGAAHVENEDPAMIVNPANHDQFGGNELCLSCHNGPDFDDWSFSHHNTANMSCSDCHTVHGTHEQSLKKKPPELCYDCHSGVRASFFMPSHHPVREGKVECSDCHGIHGGEAKFAQDFTGRELCFSCHADKEGPFVYEHAPVNEDCGYCHTPHGSVADNLLKENEPTLCLNCHPMHFHATIEGIDGEFSAPQAPERTGISHEDSFKRAMLTKCSQCHTAVHGTDLPSQSISTGGAALSR